MNGWEKEFRETMATFEAGLPHHKTGVPLSIKMRVTSGCFHREHSPHAYQAIDQYLKAKQLLDKHPTFVEHESGPEILLYMTLAAAGMTLMTSVIDLVIFILKSRREGAGHGDRDFGAIELIVRGFDQSGTLREENILRVDLREDVDHQKLQQAIENKITERIGNDSPESAQGQGSKTNA